MSENWPVDAIEAFDHLMAQHEFEAANRLAMAVADKVLAENASQWREVLWRSFFSKLDTDYIGQYQSYDFETCDYEMFSFSERKLLFRGPAPSLVQILSKECITVFGAAQLFGRFHRNPFHKIISSELAVPTLNLSMGGAGPEFFLDDWLSMPAQNSCCVVLQVLSGRSVGCEDYPGMRMTARAGTTVPKRDRIELITEIWQRDRAYSRSLVERWQTNYVRLMKELIRKSKVPVVLVWMSERSPADWSAEQLDKEPDFGAFPQLVDQAMVDEIKKDAFVYVELSPDKGLPHEFQSRFDGSLCPVFEPDGSLRWNNYYYASEMLHRELADEFAKHWPVIRTLAGESNYPKVVPNPLQISRSGDPLISVIICTRNRCELLIRALTSIVEQEFSRSDYEILVVDNNSTDRTHEIVKKFQESAPIRYLHEPQLGLCVARNTGWRHAAGRYVAFLDDDAIASPTWLAAIRDGFASWPQVGAIGGPARAIWEQPRPAWLPDEVVCSLTVVDWGPSEKLIDDVASEWLVGANMAVPRALLAEVGGFHPWLDRVGNNLVSSGDVFLQKEIIRRGYNCLYMPTMVIGHLVPASRMNQRWFIRRYYGQGISDAVMHLIEKKPSPSERIRLALTRLGQVLGSRRKVSSLLSKTDRPEAFVDKCFALIDLGFAAGLLGAARR